MFNHEKPLKIVATGHLMPTGVDEACTIVLLYSNQRMAQLTVSTNAARYAATHLIGTKGTIHVKSISFFEFERKICKNLSNFTIIKIPDYTWCPTEYTIKKISSHSWSPNDNGETFHIPVPTGKETNYTNSLGMTYEAEAVYEAISNG